MCIRAYGKGLLEHPLGNGCFTMGIEMFHSSSSAFTSIFSFVVFSDHSEKGSVGFHMWILRAGPYLFPLGWGSGSSVMNDQLWPFTECSVLLLHQSFHLFICLRNVHKHSLHA